MGVDEFLTAHEVAAELGRSVGAVRAYIRLHGLPAIRRGNQMFVPRDALAAWRADADNAAMMMVGDRLYASRKAALPA